MRSRVHSALLVSFAVAPLVSCVALLDFESLQEGSGGASATGGSAGSAGQSAGAGGDSDGDCGDCDDGDPCTVESCLNIEGEPTCVYEDARGLMPDGVDEYHWAEDHHRVTLIGGSDGFFLSLFSSGDLELHRLGAEEGESEYLTSLSSFGLADATEPLSAAGLALDDGVVLGLHAFVGVQNATGGGARTWHVVLNGSYDVALQVPVGDSYYSDLVTNHPVAANIGGKIYGAWINADQRVEISTAGEANTVFSQETSATTMSLLGTSSGSPAVLYTGTGSGVFLESEAGVTPVTECETRAGAYLSAATAPSGIPGIHFASWTKAGEGFLRNESQVVGCSAEACFADAKCEPPAAATRNAAAVTARLPGDPAGVVYYVLASPYLAPDDSMGLEAGLNMALVKIDFGPNPFAENAAEPTFESVGAAVTPSRMPTAEPLFAGPDYPALGFVAPNKVAVAWLEPDPEGGELVRLQRYAMCVGD